MGVSDRDVRLCARGASSDRGLKFVRDKCRHTSFAICLSISSSLSS
jgi:hypothetical protein